MKRSLTASLTAAVVVAAAQMASAAIVVQITPVVTGSGFGAPDAALTGYSSFTVAVLADAGEIITAVDVTFNGPLHQRWEDTDNDGVGDPSPTGVLAGNDQSDSFLAPIAEAIFAADPTEDKTSGSPLPDTIVPEGGGYDYGRGASLTGAWGIPLAQQSGSVDLGYLVVEIGQTIDYIINVADQQMTLTALTGAIETAVPGDYNGDGTVDPSDYAFWSNQYAAVLGGGAGDLAADGNGDGVIDPSDYAFWSNAYAAVLSGGGGTAVPEPATLALLGLGGLGLARRRRA